MHQRRRHHRVPRHARYVSARTLRRQPRRGRGVGSWQGGGDGDVPPSPPPPPLSQICPRSIRWKPVRRLGWRRVVASRSSRTTSECGSGEGLLRHHRQRRMHPHSDRCWSPEAEHGQSGDRTDGQGWWWCGRRLVRVTTTRHDSQSTSDCSARVKAGLSRPPARTQVRQGFSLAAQPDEGPGVSLRPIRMNLRSNRRGWPRSELSRRVPVGTRGHRRGPRRRAAQRGEAIEPQDSYGRRCATQLRPPESFDHSLVAGVLFVRRAFEAVVGFVFGYFLFVMSVLATSSSL